MSTTSRKPNQRMLMIQAFKQKFPHASDLKFHVGAKEMNQPSAPLGTSYTLPASCKFVTSMLPEQTWGITAMFRLDSSFSDFDLRRNDEIRTGQTMHALSAQLGTGPNFVTVQGKSDVMHVDCLPYRRGCDTSPWKPYLGEGTVKIVQDSGINTDSYLVVDVPHLHEAKQAYENTFGGAKQRVPISQVATHHVNLTLERTAIRNAQMIAKKFCDLTGIKLLGYERDTYSLEPNSMLPKPCALGVDRPLSSFDGKTVTVSSGLRTTSTVIGCPLACSPSKLQTIHSQTILPFSVSLPAYASLNPEKTTVGAAHHKFHSERIFYPNKDSNVTISALSALMPNLDEKGYFEQVAQINPLQEFKSLQTAAVFTL